MRKTTNIAHIEGRIYDHTLEVKESKKGVIYIGGKLNIATDDDITNIVTINYIYEPEYWGSGSSNPKYAVLKDIIDGRLCSVIGAGEDYAAKVSINSKINTNDFISRDNTLVEEKRNEGGNITVISALKPKEEERNTFSTDMIITKVSVKDADPERELPEKAIVEGWAFKEFKKVVSIIPVKFSVVKPSGISYFESLGASENRPVFTQVSGVQLSSTIVTKKIIPGAFDEGKVVESRRTNKDWVITWCSPTPYDWGDAITDEEYEALKAERATVVANVWADNEARKGTTATASSFFGSASSDDDFVPFDISKY